MADLSPSAPTHVDRKARGIYYTPPDIAHALAAWAITTRTSTVLDPSFGSGVFLKAAVDRLRQLGARHPEKHVYGADNDLTTHQYIQWFVSKGAATEQFRLDDFLTLRPRDFQTLFTVLLGNPPYIRHHTLKKKAREVARSALAEGGYQLSDLASYWAYFVMHAIRFLAPGGRLAFVLPGTLLHAHYARAVRNTLSRSFRRVTALLVQERLFPDALEESVLLLAEEHRDTMAEVRVGTLESRVLDLDEERLDRITRPLSAAERDGSWLRGILDSRTLSIYDGIAEQSVRLGQKATIRIGVVTGANDFFVIAPSTGAKLNIPARFTQPIVGRAFHLRGLTFTPKDMKGLLAEDSRLLLICPPSKKEIPPPLQVYLRMGVRRGIADRTKCADRSPWYLIPDVQAPDAFLLYMSSFSPRLVLNYAKAACTNTIHGLWWRQTNGHHRATAVVLAFLTTLTQLSAELEGRSYGGGVLKLEPSEAARLVLPLSPTTVFEGVLVRAEELYRRGRHDEATELADEKMLRRFLSFNDLDRLRSALFRLRQRRLPAKHPEAQNGRVTRRASLLQKAHSK